MREFKCRPFGDVVDLDADETYDYLPKTENELRDVMFKEIGYALCYMNYFRKEFYDGSYAETGQRERVMKLIEEFCRDDNYYSNDVKKIREQVFLFQDETENMC